MKKVIIAALLGLLLAAPASAFHFRMNLGPDARIGFFVLDPEEPMFIGLTPLELKGRSFDWIEAATRPFPVLPIIDIPIANPLVIFRIFWAPWVEDNGTNDHMHDNLTHLDGKVTQGEHDDVRE